MPAQTTSDTVKVRNATGEPRELPILGRTIPPRDVVTLPRLVGERLAEQPGWELVTGKTPTPADQREE